MADIGGKDKKREIQEFEFLDEIKSTFHNFLRGTILFKKGHKL